MSHQAAHEFLQRDPRPRREPTASPRQSEGEATHRQSGNERPQQQQRAAGEQQTAAGRCEHEQMGRFTNAAHNKQLANGYELWRVCPEVRGLYLSILGICQRLSCPLGDVDSADAIESHCRTLISEMRQIEGAAS
jgi:hypothetical protein